MTVYFSNNKPKINFQLVTFKYSNLSELDGSTRTRISKRYDLKVPFTSPEIEAQVNVLYYVNLGTNYHPEADFSLAFWYTDEAITAVEAAILTLKKKNSSTLLETLGVVRGRMAELSQEQFYPDKEVLGVISQPTIITPDVLKTLEAERKAAAFMMRSYVVSIDLNFEKSWKDLKVTDREAMLKSLISHSENLFPGIIASILVDTPMAQSPYTLLLYADHYSDVQAYMGTLSTLDIYPHLVDFEKVLICNHTSCAVLESPKDMVRRG
jgi:hypothetical protein